MPDTYWNDEYEAESYSAEDVAQMLQAAQELAREQLIEEIEAEYGEGSEEFEEDAEGEEYELTAADYAEVYGPHLDQAEKAAGRELTGKELDRWIAYVQRNDTLPEPKHFLTDTSTQAGRADSLAESLRDGAEQAEADATWEQATPDSGTNEIADAMAAGQE